MNVERFPRLAGQQRTQPRLARRDFGLVHALGDEGVPDLVGPEGIELVALAGFLDRMAGEGRGIGEAPLIKGARRQSVGRGGVIRPPAGADRVPDDGIVHEWPRSASDRLPSHALS